MNSLFEFVLNRRPLLDPIDAAVDAFSTLEEEPTVEGGIKAAGRFAGEALSNMPGGQLLANMYPEYGWQGIPVLESVTRKELFGRSEAGRFGPIPLTAITKRPFSTVVTPFGGSQARKTIKGIEAIEEGVVRSKKGKRLFKVETPGEKVRTALFGPFSTSSARDFFEKRSRRRGR